ncbi:hypothetical protein Tco_1525791 [Tanacetum coccineum]
MRGTGGGLLSREDVVSLMMRKAGEAQSQRALIDLQEHLSEILPMALQVTRLPASSYDVVKMYETFNGSSSESLDSIFNRLQKVVSQLTILGEIITPEELNLKFLRSLPTEWVYAYLATQPNGSQVVHEDLEQIHEDDLDERLKWQLALLSVVIAPPSIDLSNTGLEKFKQPDLKKWFKGKRMTSAVGEQRINDVKPTTYWAWRPKIKMINHVYKNTRSCISLAIPGQTTTGKESSNLFMAGSLPKTISPMIHLSQKVTHLEVERTSKESHAQTLTMLMKKVKRLEDKLKSIFEEEYRKLCLVLILLEAKDSKVCKITRADGSSSFHGDIQALLRRLDRQDLSQLYSLVQERFKDHPLEGHDLDLWGDLRMIFDPIKEDDIMVELTLLGVTEWKLHE